MDAILRVDLKFRLARLIAHDLVDACRAVSLRRLCVLGQIDRNRDSRIGQLQVYRLIFLVIGC